MDQQLCGSGERLIEVPNKKCPRNYWRLTRPSVVGFNVWDDFFPDLMDSDVSIRCIQGASRESRKNGPEKLQQNDFLLLFV